MKKVGLMLLLSLFKLGLYGQMPDTLPLPAHDLHPAFLHYDSNKIINPAAIHGFLKGLNRVQNLEQDRMVVLHFGDSHIQADGMSGIVRTELQKKFGNAGRGLVFPYRLVRTNHPNDYYSQSSQRWSGRKNLQLRDSISLGVAGYAAFTAEPNFVFRFGTKPFNGIENSFDRVWIMHGNGPQYFDFELLKTSKSEPVEVIEHVETPIIHKVKRGETALTVAKKFHKTAAWIRSENGLKSNKLRPGMDLIVGYKTKNVFKPVLGRSDFERIGYVRSDDSSGNPWGLSLMEFPEPLREINIGGIRTSPQQNQAAIYGLVLENSDGRGVLYHTAGVNGAQLIHFVRSDYFFDQASALQPNLIIVSLGTNEAFGSYADTAALSNAIDSLVKNMRQRVPGVEFIFTTPADAVCNKSGSCVHIQQLRQVILNKAVPLNYAVWDLWEVMGGKRSMNLWYQAGLSAPDRIHFTMKGYQLQGFLFYQAIEQAYNELQPH